MGPETGKVYTLAMVKETAVQGGRSMNWQLEAYMKMPWTYDGKDRLYNGFADYCLFYGSPKMVETNLVIVEAKTKDQIQTPGSALLFTEILDSLW
jgi:hypothetical protein